MWVCVPRLSYNTGTLHTTVSSQDRAADAQQSKNLPSRSSSNWFFYAFFWIFSFKFFLFTWSSWYLKCPLCNKWKKTNLKSVACNYFQHDEYTVTNRFQVIRTTDLYPWKEQEIRVVQTAAVPGKKKLSSRQQRWANLISS